VSHWQWNDITGIMVDSGLIFQLIRILCCVYCILCKPTLKNPLEFQWKQNFPPWGDNPKSTRHARNIKSTYYERLKYLKSDPSKDAERTYLNKAESAYIPTHPHWGNATGYIATQRYLGPNVYTKKHKPIINAKAPILSGDWSKMLSLKNKGFFRTAKLFC